MSGKNWDKPLSEAGMDVAILNPHHNLQLKSREWRKLVGLDPKGREPFYPAYLTYCKIMSSPLGKALM